MLGEALGEQPPQLRHGAGPLVEQRAGDLQHGVEIDAGECRRVVAVAGHLAVEHRLDERAQQQGVVGRDEVDRPPHDDDPHDPPFPEQRRQLVGDEAARAATTARGTG